MASSTRSRRGRPPRAEQVAANRRRLLEAAGVVFRRDGYLAATVDAIAEEAGFTRGAVYSHFSHKGDLFLTLLEERIQQREVGNQGATARALDTAGALDFVRQGIAASLDPAWRLALLEFRVVAARDPELNARYALVHSYAIESVSTSLTAIYEQTGLTPPLPVEVLASTALAMEDGSFLEAVVRGESLPAETILALVARLFGFSAPTEEAP